MSNIIALLIIAIPLIFAIKSLIKQKKNNHCIGCPLASQCHKKQSLNRHLLSSNNKKIIDK